MRNEVLLLRIAKLEATTDRISRLLDDAGAPADNDLVRRFETLLDQHEMEVEAAEERDWEDDQ